MKEKINVYVTILLIVSLFMGCSKTPNCAGKLETETLKGIFKDEFLKNKEKYQESLKYMIGEEVDFAQTEKRYDDFLANDVIIELARPIDINKELKSCECQAVLKLKFTDDWWKALLNNMKKPMEYNILYSIQKVNKNTIVITDLKLVTEINNIFLSGFIMEEMGEDPTMEH